MDSCEVRQFATKSRRRVCLLFRIVQMPMAPVGGTVRYGRGVSRKDTKLDSDGSNQG